MSLKAGFSGKCWDKKLEFSTKCLWLKDGILRKIFVIKSWNFVLLFVNKSRPLEQEFLEWILGKNVDLKLNRYCSLFQEILKYFLTKDNLTKAGKSKLKSSIIHQYNTKFNKYFYKNKSFRSTNEKAQLPLPSTHNLEDNWN